MAHFRVDFLRRAQETVAGRLIRDCYLIGRGIMNRTKPRSPVATRRKFFDHWDEIKYLYLKAGHWLYEHRKPSRAAPYIKRLKLLIIKRSLGDESVLVLSAKGLIADWEHDLPKEICYKRLLVDLLLELMKHTTDIPGYEPRNVLQEMEILALLLEDNDQRSEALGMVEKCKAFARKYKLKYREGEARKLIWSAHNT